MTVAALYVEHGGVYYGLPDVESWGLPERDAREYGGPWPVVAHPPCERWGGGPMLVGTPRQKALGDDGGCFAAALVAVRRFGGVIEHPEGSHAWRHFGLRMPDKWGLWVKADLCDGWTCCVEQGHYGHRARKATWLYAVGTERQQMVWGRSEAKIRLDDVHSAEERRRAIKTGACQRLSKRERARTPEPFRDLLLAMARSVNRPAQPETGLIGSGLGKVWA